MNISLLTFLVLLEIIVVLLILLGLMVWRLHRERGGNRIQFIDATEQHPTPSLYLDSEAARTRTFIDTLRGKPKLEPRDPALQSALGARAGFLRYESELAKTPPSDRDPSAWTALAQNIAVMLSAESYIPKQPVRIHGEDTQNSEVLVKQQALTIQHLRDYIQQLLEKVGHQPLPDEDIQGHMDELERANQELSQCVSILEDENSFLRDQIAALLKLE